MTSSDSASILELLAQLEDARSEVRDALTQLGERRRGLRSELEEIAPQLDEAVYKAFALGIGLGEISQLSGYAPSRVYQLREKSREQQQ